MVLVCKIRFARYDVGYGAGLTQVSGTANVSIDVIQKIVDNLEVHIMPSTLFNNNIKNATTLNYTDFKNGKVE